jgi:hypothetical protein
MIELVALYESFALPFSFPTWTHVLAHVPHHTKTTRMPVHNTGTFSARTSTRLACAPFMHSAPHRSSAGPGAGSPESSLERAWRDCRSVSHRSISACPRPHTRPPPAAHPPHTTCAIRAGPHGTWRLGGRSAFACPKRRNRLSRLGYFISPLCSVRFGGSLPFGACRRLG